MVAFYLSFQRANIYYAFILICTRCDDVQSQGPYTEASSVVFPPTISSLTPQKKRHHTCLQIFLLVQFPIMAPQILVMVCLLLGLVPPGLSRIRPRLSYPLGAPGRTVTSFYTPDVSNTTTLLLSDDADTLFVGARDAVLSLDVSQHDVIAMRGQLDWAPSDKDLDDCSMKGKDKADCPNFIRVLQFLNSTHIYACGTHAFSPRCTYINTESFSLVTGPGGRSEEGRGRCPYDPYQRNTAITVDGELYTGTVADYRGNRPVISRHLSEGSHVDLKLDDTLGWLEDPTFISSSFLPSEDKIYFFFSEEGREYDFIEKFTVSRIAQVCTTDVGGQRTLQRRWTTFAKAQLLCQAEGQLPYSVLQDMFTLPPPEGGDPDDTLFYGVFSSQWSATSGRSAVCAFRLGDIKAVFAGNYKVLNRDTLRWSTRLQEKVANPGECGLHNASDNTLRFIKENFLADDSVRSLGQSVTLESEQQLYTHLLVQRVPALNGREYSVLFLLTESGFLHKVVLLEKGAHIIEEIQILKQPQAVKNMLLSLAKGVVLVGSSEGVVRVPVANCSLSQSCADCVLAQDPFCAWDHSTALCTDASTLPANAGQDVETGNVHETCQAPPMAPRSRFGQKLPTGELVFVSLNEVVRLQCPEASLLAQRHWERPSSRLDPHIYLQLQDGSLTFLASPATLGHYLCLSTENSFQQTLAVYQVRQKTGTTAQPLSTPPPPPPRSHPPALPSPAAAATPRPTSSSKPPHPGSTGVGLRNKRPTLLPTETVFSTRPPSRKPTLWLGRTEPPAGGEQQLWTRGQTYLKELVVVSVLLAVCVSVLLTVALYHMKRRCRRRTVPQVAPGRDSERGAAHEREALRGSQSPHGPDKQNGKANGTLSNGTPKGSNGHLPNIPM